jgi:Sir2- and TIR-associating SLOG family
MTSDRRKTVFISGSAYEYGSFGDSGQGFIRDLAKTLLRNDFRIVSGFGSGVGNHIIEGALFEIYLEKKGNLTDHFRMYPFPGGGGSNGYNGARSDGLDAIWGDYRSDMISQAGIAIFIFGNKLEDISVREAEGMWKEFEIARSHRALLIPVGASGYTSEKLWKILLEKYDDYFDSREKFALYERLGQPCTGTEDVSDLIDVILQIAQ